MNKGYITNLLRKCRIMYIADWFRYYTEKWKNRKSNQDFKAKNSDVPLPPDYLMYESFRLNYQKYYTDSIETAQWLLNFFTPYMELKDVKILDWGCGPGRIIRHLPHLLKDKNCEFFGTDYNKNSIDWCAANIKGVSFNNNTLEAKLPYENNFFDIIYGISIFTHLSEKLHYEWYNELYRVLKSGGILFLTTHGDSFKVKMTHEEIARYNTGELIVRGNVKEGHRTFTAFQPAKFMTHLFSNAEVLEHIVSKEATRQDIWIIKKT